MKKISEKKKLYIKSAITFFMIFIFNLSTIMIKELNNLDELWNFNFANCFANGLIPYKEFNMVITPFSSMFESVFLKIFGQEIYVSRILGAILVTYIESITLIIFTKLKIKDYIKYLILFLEIYLITPFIAYDYNLVILALVLTIICLELKDFIKENKILKYNLKNDLIIGVLLGLCVITKQSTGGVILIIRNII